MKLSERAQGGAKEVAEVERYLERALSIIRTTYYSQATSSEELPKWLAEVQAYFDRCKDEPNS